jgi:hypothetical protein
MSLYIHVYIYHVPDRDDEHPSREGDQVHHQLEHLQRPQLAQLLKLKLKLEVEVRS